MPMASRGCNACTVTCYNSSRHRGRCAHFSSYTDCASAPPGAFLHRIPSHPNKSAQPQTLGTARASRLRCVFHRARAPSHSAVSRPRCAAPAPPVPGSRRSLPGLSGCPSWRAPGTGRAARSRRRAVPAPYLPRFSPRSRARYPPAALPPRARARRPTAHTARPRRTSRLHHPA